MKTLQINYRDLPSTDFADDSLDLIITVLTNSSNLSNKSSEQMGIDNMILLCQGLLLGVLAASVPGQDWVIVARSTLRHGLGGGLSCTAGIGLGLTFYCVATLVLCAAGTNAPPRLLAIIKIAGALYIILIGSKWLYTSGSDTMSRINEEIQDSNGGLSRHWDWQYFHSSFWVGCQSALMNPKLLLWFAVVVFQLVGYEPTWSPRVAILAGLMAGDLIFFCCLSLAFGAIRTKIPNRCEVLIDRLAGTLLIGWGIALLLLR